MTHFGRRRRQLRRRFAVEMAARSPVPRAFDAYPTTPESVAEPVSESAVSMEPQPDHRRPLPFEISDESQSPPLTEGLTPEIVVPDPIQPVAPVPAVDSIVAEAL